jgi:rRNA maturation endonuclease Nob1
MNAEEHLDQNTPHVEAPVDQANNNIESENDDDLDDDNLTNRELYNLLLKMYRKTTKKQER